MSRSPCLSHVMRNEVEAELALLTRTKSIVRKVLVT